MPKSPIVSSNERLDKEDFDSFVTYAKESSNLSRKVIVSDKHCQIIKGFHIEIPSQSSFPGRVVVHAGSAMDFAGNILYNEDQADVSRTITLEGISSDFYLEIEFVESESDTDARAFWDPSVDQGTDPSGDPKPTGQEFSTTIAVKKSSDWRIVQPISTSNFERDTNPASLKVPLAKITTDPANVILTTAPNPAATVLLKSVMSGETQILVQDSTLLPVSGGSLKVGLGTGLEETVSVTSNNRSTGLMTISALANPHLPGAIISETGTGIASYLADSEYSRFEKDPYEATQIDFRDKLFKGDAMHGLAMIQSLTSVTGRSDSHIESLKEYINYLAAIVQEMKFGSMNPFISNTDAS